MSSDYRKIYRETKGDIPKDENGRSYDIHHRDGNHANNHPDNLKAVSIIEHYEIHKSQGDWSACQAIAMRMNGLSGEEISSISSKAAFKRIERGNHHFVGPGWNERLKSEGRHPFIGGAQSSKNARKLVAEGRHPFTGGKIQSESNKRRIADRTHNLLGGEIVKRQLKEGTHNFQKRRKCPYCELESNVGAIACHIKAKHKGDKI